MKPTITSTTKVSGSEYHTMMNTTEPMAKTMVSRLGRAWPMSWRMASTSLV